MKINAATTTTTDRLEWWLGAVRARRGAAAVAEGTGWMTKARPGKRGAARASGSLTAWIWLRLVVVVVV